jgi:hypothetical protein
VASGTALFRAICELDMEGIVAKQAAGLYRPEATTWVKIKNRAYSQAVGRSDFFDRGGHGNGTKIRPVPRAKRYIFCTGDDRALARDLRAGWSGSVVRPHFGSCRVGALSPYPGFGNQPEFHRLDFALVDANHALDAKATG